MQILHVEPGDLGLVILVETAANLERLLEHLDNLPVCVGDDAPFEVP